MDLLVNIKVEIAHFKPNVPREVFQKKIADAVFEGITNLIYDKELSEQCYGTVSVDVTECIDKNADNVTISYAEKESITRSTNE